MRLESFSMPDIAVLLRAPHKAPGTRDPGQQAHSRYLLQNDDQSVDRYTLYAMAATQRSLFFTFYTYLDGRTKPVKSTNISTYYDSATAQGSLL